jgi:hypothetical protein
MVGRCVAPAQDAYGGITELNYPDPCHRQGAVSVMRAAELGQNDNLRADLHTVVQIGDIIVRHANTSG